MQRLKKFGTKLWQIFQEDLMHVNIGVESAAMAYYMLLSVIPMVMLVANILPLLPIPIDVIFKLQWGRAFYRFGDFILASVSDV